MNLQTETSRKMQKWMKKKSLKKEKKPTNSSMEETPNEGVLCESESLPISAKKQLFLID